MISSVVSDKNIRVISILNPTNMEKISMMSGTIMIVPSKSFFDENILEETEKRR